MQKNQAIPLYFYFLTLLLLLSGCNSCQSHKASEIRIGLNPWSSFEFIFLAEEINAFQDLGVQVRLLEYETLHDLRRAFERGHIDGMGISPTEIIQTNIYSTRQLKLFYITDFSNGSNIILARAPITSVKELAGKKIAVEVGSLGIFLLVKALEQNSLKIDDVAIVPSDHPSFYRKLNNNTVDAVVSFLPLSHSLEKLNQLNVIFSSAEIPEQLLGGLAYDAKLIEKKRDSLAKLILAIEKAHQYVAENPEAYQFMAHKQAVSPNEFIHSIEGIKLLGLEDQQKWFSNEQAMLNFFHSSLKVLEVAGQVPENASNIDLHAWDPGPSQRAYQSWRRNK